MKLTEENFTCKICGKEFKEDPDDVITFIGEEFFCSHKCFLKNRKLTKEDIKKYGTLREQKILNELLTLMDDPEIEGDDARDTGDWDVNWKDDKKLGENDNNIDIISVGHIDDIQIGRYAGQIIVDPDELIYYVDDNGEDIQELSEGDVYNFNPDVELTDVEREENYRADLSDEDGNRYGE